MGPGEGEGGGVWVSGSNRKGAVGEEGLGWRGYMKEGVHDGVVNKWCGGRGGGGVRKHHEERDT